MSAMAFYEKDKQRCPYLYDQLKPFFASKELVYLRKRDPKHDIVKKYLMNTNKHNYTLELIQVFRVFRKGEYDRYKHYKHFSNRKLLWHGSKASNFSSILSNGLIIPNPGQVTHGSSFGNAIYFTDMSSTATNYSNSKEPHPHLFLLLCEVALGHMAKIDHVKAIDKLRRGFHSLEAQSTIKPDPKGNKKLQNGAIVPLGNPINSNINGIGDNEFMVYKEAQVLIKYLVEIKLG